MVLDLRLKHDLSALRQQQHITVTTIITSNATSPTVTPIIIACWLFCNVSKILAAVVVADAIVVLVLIVLKFLNAYTKWKVFVKPLNYTFLSLSQRIKKIRISHSNYIHHILKFFYFTLFHKYLMYVRTKIVFFFFLNFMK